MPYGVLADIFCIILGGIIGPNLNIKITYKYREPLIKIFGISALAIGIVSPDRPSLNAPKILVSLAQKVAATNK